jgi:hypothetical protein
MVPIPRESLKKARPRADRRTAPVSFVKFFYFIIGDFLKQYQLDRISFFF